MDLKRSVLLIDFMMLKIVPQMCKLARKDRRGKFEKGGLEEPSFGGSVI